MAYNVYISCDRCGLTYNWINHTVNMSTATMAARSKGWQVGKRGWLCNFCKHKVSRKAKGE
jgi:hypothetical protein